jgi:hypothetical protein
VVARPQAGARLNSLAGTHGPCEDGAMPTASPAEGPLVELRSYEIVPGGVDAFVDHFEAHFLDTQAAVGMDVVGQFRVVDDPDRFVWIRHFPAASSRGTALGAFYGGPDWAEHGPRANELMVDHTDVHLLVVDPSSPPFPADIPTSSSGARPDAEAEAGAGEDDGADGPTPTVVAALFEVDAPATLPPALGEALRDALADADGVVEHARLVSAGIDNDFPPLPVHDDLRAVWLVSDLDGGARAGAAADAAARRAGLAHRVVRLRPTPRSAPRWRR